MNDSTLESFRAIAAAMQTEPTTWAWVGAHASQRMFGITESRAKDYAKTFGGTASEMPAPKFPHAFMRRLAYDRGLRGFTFSTADESRWPGYDKAWRAGARRAEGR